MCAVGGPDRNGAVGAFEVQGVPGCSVMLGAVSKAVWVAECTGCAAAPPPEALVLCHASRELQG